MGAAVAAAMLAMAATAGAANAQKGGGQKKAAAPPPTNRSTVIVAARSGNISEVIGRATAMRSEAEVRAYYGGAAVRSNYSAAAGSLERMLSLVGASDFSTTAPPGTRDEARQDVQTLWREATNTRNAVRSRRLKRAAYLYASAATRYFRAADREGRVEIPAGAEQAGGQVAEAGEVGAVEVAPNVVVAPGYGYPAAGYGYPQFYPYAAPATVNGLPTGPRLFNYGPQFGAQVLTLGAGGVNGFGGYANYGNYGGLVPYGYGF